MKPSHKLMFYDEFSVSEQNSSYYGWAKKNTRPKVKSNEAKRNRANGLLAIDIDTGKEYLWLSSHAQSDDVARYMAHLTLEMSREKVEKLEIVLDNNTTHRQKMQRLFIQEVKALAFKEQTEITTEVVFTYIPAYSPKLNLVEYAIHLLRQRCLHHRPYNMNLEQIEEKIRTEILKRPLLNPSQIINILNFIENQILIPF
jgi:transposase